MIWIKPEFFIRRFIKRLMSYRKFIENPEVVDMKENKEVGKAKKVLEEISQDEHERYLTELRQMSYS